MVFFNKGERVWASSKDVGWVLGTVVAQEAQMVVVKLDTGEELKFPEGRLVQFVPESLQDFDDMVRINDLNEPVLLHNLKQRYASDKIYTLIGPVLVSMNPYRTLPIYTRQIMKDYSATRPGDPKNVKAPHIFSIANNAYRSLLSNRLNQSVVISGESGAGKTESTKFVLQYLAYVSDPLSTGKVEQQILESSPILEAFGNAKTIRNNNSSRFGKFTKITFDQRGHISGAEITNYLLEKSRIPYHATNERNYHVFYQLCRGASADERRILDLGTAESYVYLNRGNAVSIPGVDDAADYRRLRNAMTILGLAQGEQLEIFRVLSAILHLGNLVFEPKPNAQKEEWRVQDRQLLATTAKLLGTDPERLESAFIRRSFQASASRKSTYAIMLNQRQAEESRDALSKTLYGILFDWLVDRVNQPLKPARADDLFIGVLDIFGFEIFETNSFEQVLINLTNEKILQLFNQHMFKSEQAEYKAEGINFSQVVFKDNQEVIDMVEKRPVGILHLLDEECVLPNGNEKALLDKMTSNHQNNKFFFKKRTHPTVFGIKHYAGDVDYEVSGMMDKNRDTLFPDLENLMKDSQCSFIASLFNRASMPPAAAAAANSPTTATPTTTAPAGPMSAGAKWAASHGAASSASPGPLASTIQRGGRFGAQADATNAISGMQGAATIKRAAGVAGGGASPTSAAMSPTLKREVKTGGRATVSTQFREQLSHLSTILSNTNVHYIWCIKPNTAQKPSFLDELYLLNQMRCTGIMETIKIRKQGYAARKPFDEFVHRYKILFARGTVFSKQNAKPLSLQLLQYYAADTPDQWQVGKSKVFLRERQLYLLDVQREEQLGAVANTIIHAMRGFVARRKYLRMKAERERKRREEAERKRREEEERRRREEEERRRREEAERIRREEEERRRQAEELRRRQEEEERRRRAEEERRYREDEERRRRDEEDRRRADEERRRQEDERRRQAQEDRVARLREEEERRRAAAAAQAAAEEDAVLLRQQRREEERRRILAAQAALPPAPLVPAPPPPVLSTSPTAVESLTPAELARRQREAELAKKREELEKRRADLQRRKEEEERKRRELEARIEDHHQPSSPVVPAVAKIPIRVPSNYTPDAPPSASGGGAAPFRVPSNYTPDAPPSSSGGAAPIRVPSNYDSGAHIAKPAPLRHGSNYETPGSPGTPTGSRLLGAPRQMGLPPPPPPPQEEAPYSLANLPPPPMMYAPPPPVFFPTEPAPPPPLPESAPPDVPPPAINNGYRNFYTSMPNVPVVGSGMVDLKIGQTSSPKQPSPLAQRIEDNTPSASPGRGSPLDARIVSTPADKLLNGTTSSGPTPLKATSSYQTSGSPLAQSAERTRTGTVTRGNPGGEMSALDFLAITSEPQSPTLLSPKRAETANAAGTVKRNDPPRNGVAPNPYEESTEEWFRFNIINETITTEREYVRDIMLLIEIYLLPLRASSLVNASEIQALFSNVELLVNLNKQLLAELEKSQYPYENIMIGQIFHKLSEYFKMYKVYCANHPTSIQVYESIAKSNPKFVKFIEQASQDIRCRGLMLSSFLIKPVQRVLKYPLLLKELRKYTKPDHPDSANLAQAQAKIDELAAALNESQRLAEGLQKIVDLQNSIEDCGELVTPTRRLLKDMAFTVRPDSVNEKPSERHVFLFNDLILIAAKHKSFAKKAIQWQSRAQIYIADCKIIFIAEDTLNNTFGLESVVGRKTYTYILTAADAQSKKEWFDLLKELKKQAQIKAIGVAPKKIIIPEQFNQSSSSTMKKR